MRLATPRGFTIRARTARLLIGRHQTEAMAAGASPKDRGHVNEGWWSSWGKPASYLLLGIVAVVRPILLALILVGVIF
jgi:hypothetical protein